MITLIGAGISAPSSRRFYSTEIPRTHPPAPSSATVTITKLEARNPSPKSAISHIPVFRSSSFTPARENQPNVDARVFLARKQETRNAIRKQSEHASALVAISGTSWVLGRPSRAQLQQAAIPPSPPPSYGSNVARRADRRMAPYIH